MPAIKMAKQVSFKMFKIPAKNIALPIAENKIAGENSTLILPLSTIRYR